MKLKVSQHESLLKRELNHCLKSETQ